MLQLVISSCSEAVPVLAWGDWRLAGRDALLPAAGRRRRLDRCRIRVVIDHPRSVTTPTDSTINAPVHNSPR